MSGKYFNELPSPIQIHLLYNITIPVTFFYSGSIKVLAYTFVASNDGNPMSWHEKRSVLCKNNFVRFFISYSLQHAEREKFWAKIAKVVRHKIRHQPDAPKTLHSFSFFARGMMYLSKNRSSPSYQNTEGSADARPAR